MKKMTMTRFEEKITAMQIAKTLPITNRVLAERPDLFSGKIQMNLVKISVQPGVNSEFEAKTAVLLHDCGHYVKEASQFKTATLPVSSGKVTVDSYFNKVVIIEIDKDVAPMLTLDFSYHAHTGYVYGRKIDGTLFNLTKGVKVERMPVGTLQYSGKLAYTSSSKVKSCAYVSALKSEAKDLYCYYNKYTQWRNSIFDCQEKANKSMTRFALGLTGQNPFISFTNILIVKDITGLDENGKGKGLADGFVSAKGEAVKELINYDDSVESLCRENIQMRVSDDFIAKFQLKCGLTDEFMLQLRFCMKQNYVWIHIDGAKIEDVQVILDLNAIKEFGLFQKELNNIDSVSSEVSITSPVVFNVLKFAHSSEGTLSKPVVNTLFANCKTVDECETVKNFIINCFEKQLIAESRELESVEPKQLSLESKHNMDILEQECPSTPIGLSSKLTQFANKVNNICNKMKIAITNKDGKSEANFYTLVPSKEALMGLKSVIGEKEAFVPALKHLSEKELKTRVLFKYPVLSGKEFGKIKFLTKKELVRRIMSNPNFTDKEKRALIKAYSVVDHNSIYISDMRLLKLVAGSDFDIDAAVIINFPKAVYDIFPETSYISLDTKAKVNKNNRGVVTSSLLLSYLEESVDISNLDLRSETFFERNFKNQIKGNVNIGLVTNEDEVVKAILAYTIVTGDTSYAVEFVKAIYGSDKQGRSLEYVAMDRENISVVSVDKQLKHFKTCKWTLKNLCLLLEDIDLAFRLYQEGGIDYSKTLENIEKVINVRHIKIASHRKSYVDYNDGDRLPVIKKDDFRSVPTNVGYGKNSYTTSTLEMVDYTGQLQDTMIETFNAFFKPLVKKVTENIRFSVDETSAITDVFNYARVNNEEAFQDALTHKNIINEIQSEYYETLNELTRELHPVNDKDEIDGIKAQQKELFKSKINGVSKSVRNLLENFFVYGINGARDSKANARAAKKQGKKVNKRKLTNKEQGILLLGLSMAKATKGGYVVNFDKSAKFAVNVGIDKVISALVGKDVVTASSKVVTMNGNKDGEYYFINGISEDGIIIKDRYTGTADVHCGVASVEKNVKDYCDIDESQRVIVLLNSSVCYENNGVEYSFVDNKGDVQLNYNEVNGCDELFIGKKSRELEEGSVVFANTEDNRSYKVVSATTVNVWVDSDLKYRDVVVINLK